MEPRELLHWLVAEWLVALDRTGVHPAEEKAA